MKSYLQLASKELLTQKVTSVLILLAVMLSTLMTTAIGQSAGILAAMRAQQAIALDGNRYATFVQMNDQQVAALQSDPRLSYTGISIVLGTHALNPSLSLGLTEYLNNSLETYPSLSRVKEGRLPEQAMEIALPEDVLQFLGFQGRIGDPITLSVSKALRHGIEIEAFDYTASFTLTGILESSYLGYAAGSVQGIVGAHTAQALLPEAYLYYNVDIRTADKKQFQATMDALSQELHIPQLDCLYHTTYLRALGIDYSAEAADTDTHDTGFSFLVLAGVLVVLLILLAAGLVIYNILKIAVSRRIRAYGTLRAIGAERGQVYAIVLTEVLILCILGIPTGILLGLLSAQGILTAATSLLSPDIFLAQNTTQLHELIAENASAKGLFLLLSAAITLSFALLAALPAARFAAKVSPIMAMSGPTLKIKRRKRTVKRIRSFERYYARLNLKRSRGRTAVTILSLVMSMTVFITLQSFVALLSIAGPENEHLGDYSLVNQTTGFSGEALKTLESSEYITAVAAMQFALYLQDDNGQLVDMPLDIALQPGETFQIVGLNPAYWDHYFDGQLTTEQLAALKAGNGCVIRNPIPLVLEGKEIPRTTIPAGSTITVAGQELPVLETLDGYDIYLSVASSGFTNGVQVIVSDSLYKALTGSEAYAELLPILKPGADRQKAEALIDGLCQQFPATTCLSFEQTDQELEDSFAQIRLLAWGLILFIGLIGLLNIINTVTTNIHTRTAEIGIQRAIGMSCANLYQTFLWEGAYYGMIAALIGCSLGYLGTLVVHAAASNAFQLVAPPIAAMAEATFLSIAACLMATCLPLYKITQLAIVEAIETVD